MNIVSIGDVKILNKDVETTSIENGPTVVIHAKYSRSLAG